MNITRLDMFAASLHSVCMNVCLLGGVCSIEAALLGICISLLKGRSLNTLCNYLPCHLLGRLLLPRRRLSHPETGHAAVFFPMPSLLFAEQLPRHGVSREPKYVCVCARKICIWASVCPAIGALHVCVCVGVCAEWKHWWDAWHKQGRVVGGWCQGLTPTTRLDALSDS